MPDWQPIETAPNNVFDVLAKYWDASLDTFLVRRFIDCVQVEGQIYAATVNGQFKLVDAGYRPTHWAHIPELPPTSPTGSTEKA